MAFTGRTRAAIRDELLALWAAEYLAATPPQRLLIAPGSDADLWASAIAVETEGLEAQAEQTARDILPDQASTEALDRHGEVDGVARRPGTVTQIEVTVSGTANGTFSIPAGTQLVYSDGTRYDVGDASVVLSGGSHEGTLSDVSSAEAGTETVRAVGDTLTFVSTPTGLDPTGEVSVVTAGTDEETDAAYAARIIARRQERPASGNRADWQDWVESYQGTTVSRAFVYPELAPPASYPGAGTVSTPGTLTVVAVGPARGLEPTDTRLVPTDDALTRTSGAQLARIEGYIEGDRTITGVLTDDGEQLRPITVPSGNYGVETFTESAVDVVATVVVDAANAYQWSGTMTVAGSGSTATSLVVTGDQTAKNGMRVLLFPATPSQAGRWEMHTLGTGTFGGVDTTFPIDEMLDGAAPVAASTVYPAPANFNLILEEVCDYFDSLGPGDTSPASRWPAPSTEYPAVMYLQALAAAIMRAEGVLSATVTTPASDQTPAAKAIKILSLFRVVQ